MATVSRSGRARAAVLQLPQPPAISREGISRLLPSGRALVVGFALVALTVLAYFGARESSVFAIRTVEISGASPRVAAHVRAALRPLDGKSLLALGSADVHARLDGLPDVAAVSYDRSFPHTLKVTVVPAHSTAVVRGGAAAWIVSSSGRVVRASGPRAAPRLPRIWLPASVDVAVGSQITDPDASRAIEALALARTAGFDARIKTVKSQNELTFVLASGLEVRFGDPSDLAVKVAVARAILPRVSSSAYLDVSAPDRPVAGSNPKVSG